MPELYKVRRSCKVLSQNSERFVRKQMKVYAAKSKTIMNFSVRDGGLESTKIFLNGEALEQGEKVSLFLSR